MKSAQQDRPMRALLIAQRVPRRTRLTRRWTAFESRHRRLVDDLTAAAVALLAIAGWYVAFALFAN